MLFSEGDRVNQIYFVAKGILHHFNYNEAGQIKTLNLHNGPCFCTDLESFTSGTISRESVKSLSDCTLYVLTKEKYQLLITADLKWSNLVKRITEITFIHKLEQMRSMTNRSVEERYLELAKDKPEIIQQVSIQIIASYLGVSRETLHRIRKRNSVA